MIFNLFFNNINLDIKQNKTKQNRKPTRLWLEKLFETLDSLLHQIALTYLTKIYGK